MTTTDIHLYWATGCTSCLRVKEFLERNSVAFNSHNVIAEDDDNATALDESPIGVHGVDEELIDEMESLGLPQHVPVVRYGDEWADGKDLQDVARLLDIDYAAEPLPVEELYNRLETVLDATHDFIGYLPEDEFETYIPDRPRSYADLVQHIFTLPDVYLMHEAGVAMDSVPRMEHDWNHHSTVALSTYGHSVQGRLSDWFAGPAQSCDWSETADVFWGRPSKHEFFERTTWHTGQHVRQLEWILTEELNVAVDTSLDPMLWEGLPMPEKIWNE